MKQSLRLWVRRGEEKMGRGYASSLSFSIGAVVMENLLFHHRPTMKAADRFYRFIGKTASRMEQVSELSEALFHVMGPF